MREVRNVQQERLSVQVPNRMNVTRLKCNWCDKRFIEYGTHKKSRCSCGGVGHALPEPQLLYHTDILYVIAWIAFTIGTYWIFNHYKTQWAETLFATFGACIPFITLVLVLIPRFVEWRRAK